MTIVYERLKALQITLPDLQPPVADGYVAAFVPFVQTGNLVYLAGRLAKKMASFGRAKWGRKLPHSREKKPHAALPSWVAFAGGLPESVIGRRLGSTEEDSLG